MIETSKVSIIVPVYKVPENYLKACIESCLNKTLKDIETIPIVGFDDNPDNSSRSVKKLD